MQELGYIVVYFLALTDVTIWVTIAYFPPDVSMHVQTSSDRFLCALHILNAYIVNH